MEQYLRLTLMKTGIFIVAIKAMFLLDFVQGANIQSTTREELELALNNSREQCFITIAAALKRGNVTDNSSCMALWDNVMCWPETPAGTRMKLHCPSYINRFNTDKYAFRDCLPNGTWYHYRPDYINSSTKGWTNFSDCTRLSFEIDGVHSVMKLHVGGFRRMYHIGYMLSLVSLLLAAFIIIVFNKLHCARNYIHLNLFVSFLLRATLSIIRENLFVADLGFRNDVIEHANGSVDFLPGPHWECKLFYTLTLYVMMASYMWIFMEAVYINMVIFVTVFNEKARVIWYIIVGWSVPLPFTISWAFCKLLLENQWCWHMSDRPGLKWIYMTPILIAVVLNILFFINIVRLLFTKLNSVSHSDVTRNRYRTLARSIVVLIPLFGVYYILLAFPFEHVDNTTSFIILFIEMFFNSYQGLFIAILLCFANSEVQSEIRKCWNGIYYRRFSNMSKGGSQVFSQSHGQRSLSTTRLSETTTINKRLSNGRNVSLADIETTLPLATATRTARFTLGDNELTVNENGCVPECNNLKFKINVVNIECESRDGLKKNLTSFDIQTLKNGCVITNENISNNNVSSGNRTNCLDEAMPFMEETM